jgi:hypothetical protein
MRVVANIFHATDLSWFSQNYCNCIHFLASTLCLVSVEMAEDKRSDDAALAGFYESMEKTNVEKITNEILAGLSVDSRDRGFWY